MSWLADRSRVSGSDSRACTPVAYPREGPEQGTQRGYATDVGADVENTRTDEYRTGDRRAQSGVSAIKQNQDGGDKGGKILFQVGVRTLCPGRGSGEGRLVCGITIGYQPAHSSVDICLVERAGNEGEQEKQGGRGQHVQFK